MICDKKLFYRDACNHDNEPKNGCMHGNYGKETKRGRCTDATGGRWRDSRYTAQDENRKMVFDAPYIRR